MNTHRLAINAYKRADNQSLNAQETVAMAFDVAARSMERAALAIETKDYETRFKESEKVARILSVLNNNIEGDEASDLVHDLKVYYQRMTLMVSDMNVFNDVALAKELSQSFRKMGNFWHTAKVE